MPISGSSPNKLFSRTDGTRSGTDTWQQSASAARGVQPVDQDFHDDDIATAINTCLFKDGGNAATGNIPMGGHKFTGLTSGSTSGDSVTYDQMNTAIAVAVAALIPSTSVMSFFQAAAPTGWTQNVTYDDSILRVVSGTGGGAKTNGSGLSTFATGTTGGHSVTQAELPNCSFTVTDPGHAHTTVNDITSGTGLGNGTFKAFNPQSTTTSTTGISVTSGGSGTAHTHSMNISVNYVDMILCSKN